MAWLVGYPREKIQWYPTVDLSKCVKCGMCMNCGKNVFEWTENGPKVARPYECTISCTVCANLCPGNAISFPDVRYIRDLYKKEGIWAKVKEQMLKSGKIW